MLLRFWFVAAETYRVCSSLHINFGFFGFFTAVPPPTVSRSSAESLASLISDIFAEQTERCREIGSVDALKKLEQNADERRAVGSGNPLARATAVR